MGEPPKTPKPPNDAFDERTYAIIGCALEVQHVLGTGFLERVYQLALAAEMRRRGIPYEHEVAFPIRYKGEALPCEYRADFVCYGEVLVETKAILALGNIEVAQVLNYLRASGLQTGLLLNFGGGELEVRRLGFSPEWRRAPWIRMQS